MMRDALNRTAKHEIGNKREQDCYHRRLDRVERLEHHPLVKGVHHDAKDQDSRRRDDSFPQASAPPLGVADAVNQRPDIRPSPEPRVHNAIAQRGDEGHCRLKNETEGHRAARPIQNIAPQATETLVRNAIPEHAARDEAHNEAGRQSRLNERASRGRICQDRADPRATQRKPTWLVDVSIGSAWRAAGR